MFPNSQVLNSIWRAAVALIVFAAPILLTQFPAVGDLTLSAVVFAIVHYLEKTVTA